MTIYLTGFSGLLGSAFREFFAKEQHEITLLGRQKPYLYKNESYLNFDLKHSLSVEDISLTGDCLVIHCAYDFNLNSSTTDSINFKGTQNLIHSFSKCETVKFIYFSTPLNSTNLFNTSFYQKEKFATEKLFKPDRDLILSPSFLVSHKGKTNKLFNFIQRLKIPIPVPSRTNNIAPIKVNDFTSMIFTKLIKKDVCGKFLIVGSNEQSFASFLKEYYQIRSIKLPIFCIRFIEIIFRIFRFNYLSERVKGLLNLPDLEELKKTEDFIEIRWN